MVNTGIKEMIVIASITYEEIKANEEIRTCISAGNNALGALGFTEHSFAHVTRTAEVAAMIIEKCSLLSGEQKQREIELTKIAGFMHDIGNMVNRDMHALTGATIAFTILQKLGMPADEISKIITAIGNHDENTGRAVSDIAAALIIADKSDVRRSRVRKIGSEYQIDKIMLDIHDRVNYAVTKSIVTVDNDKKVISLSLNIDTDFSPVMDYFEIFMSRMLMCRRAAEYLNHKFNLYINKHKII